MAAPPLPPATIDLSRIRDTEPVLRGSVQNLYGVDVDGAQFLLSEATDAGSAFDVGSYFSIPGSGSSRTELRHAVFVSLSSPSAWSALDQSAIDKVTGAAGSRYGASPLLATLRREGARTHHCGLVESGSGRITDEHVPTSMALVRRFPVVRPTHVIRDGLGAWDYHQCHLATSKVVPLENIFRLGCPAGSSILLRYDKAIASGDTDLAAQILTEAGRSIPLVPWQRFDALPYDCSTKYEHQDRPLTWQETVHVAGIEHETLAEMIDLLALCTVMTSAMFDAMGFSLWDIKWEAAVDGTDVIVVDTVDHDSVRITTDQDIDGRHCHVHLNKQAIRDYYRILHGDWIAALDDAKGKEATDAEGRAFRSIYDAGVASGTYPPIPALDPAYARIQGDKYDVVAGGASGRYQAADCRSMARKLVDAEIDFYAARSKADVFLERISERKPG